MADQHFHDDEAPEEVTLNEGREEAEKSRKEEKEMKKRIAAESKQRRKAMSGEKPKEVVSGIGTERNGVEAADLPETMGRMSRKGRHGDGKCFGEKTLEEQDPGTVMLEDSVLKLIQAKHKQVAMGASQAKHIYIKDRKIKKASRPALEINTDSRTKIVSLKSRLKSAATTNAVEFRQSQMFGQHRKRSHSMLSIVSKPFKASV